MTDGEKNKGKRADARHLVWLLTWVGLVAGAVVFCVTAPTLQYIRYHYEASAAQRSRIDQAIAEIQQNLVDGRRDFAEIILAPGSHDAYDSEFSAIQDAHWYKNLRKAVVDVRQDPNFQNTSDVVRLSQLLQQIPETYLDTLAWSVAVAAAESEKVAAQKKTQQTLHRIRAFFAEMEGKRRLDLALQLKRHAPKASGRSTVAHDDLVESFRVAAEYEAIANELMQLAILCEKLAAEHDVDQLVSLKDNELKATFSRLEHALERFSGDREAVRELTQELESSLFGEGCVFDDVHQTIQIGDGGVYYWQREELLGMREQSQRLRQVEEKFDAFRPVLSDLEIHFARVDAEERRGADLAGMLAWTIMIVTGIVCVCLFVILARRIAGIITQQIEDVQRNSSELERKNAEVRLLQDVAEAANKTASLAETVEFVMRRFAQHSGFPFALATFTDERGARQVVATEAWLEAGLSMDPIVASCGGDRSVNVAVRPLSFEQDDLAPQCNGPKSGVAIMMRQDMFFIYCHFISTDVDSPAEELLRLAEQVAHRLSQTLERAQANSRLKDLNSKLIDSARHAGMAEVATGVLHNVGNALNSVNTSLSFLQECTAQSSYVDLGRTLELVVKQSGSLEEFMLSHPKRQLIQPMLAELEERLRGENEKQLAEVEDLRRHIDHIKKIVAVQQSLARVQCILEPTDLVDALTKAIEWQAEGLLHHHVDVEADFPDLPLLKLDKHRVLEIFGNLLKNAMESIVEAKGTQRRVTIGVRQLAAEKIAIEVRDTGLGVKPENLNSIFSYGFTTKSNGHGFGLHSASLSAKQMGGKLEIESDGLGMGALFRLTLPYSPVMEDALA
ncbi:HAMP domain-containing histidine kinase [Blastopirellula sp. JC732]|uniref:histidine kinase n=1 Tax=Blastopirellula sediminis TaxID=2894196 RepID=A0A9X1SJ43_9BACT|nr:HAMP domain-containing sensor histidine kinase [Blastopirellula sediminis]MCC9605204.1 HAMP domain-containing histidine kinase [Blastopirellula sediminis]MCC9631496.1 HAMP domain-containing histidine kinase [Blastopirellula sediminis]